VTPPAGPTVRLALAVNGADVEIDVESGDFLLDVIRERLGLTGAKRSCDAQVCGACTVLLDGRPVSACTVLAWEARGRHVETIEGLARHGALHPVQAAFLEESAFQCGFCTPGMILASVKMAEGRPGISDAEVRHGLEGNFCRCTGYQNIVKAVQAGAAEMGGQS
jgi:aerobic carbon-monoxide dehydrogenase small subunit